MARREEERTVRESNAKAQVAEHAAVTAFAARIEKDDTGFLINLFYRCASMAESTSIYNVAIDHRDPEEVRRLLKNLNPYDYDSKIKYIGLPELDEAKFSQLIAKNAIEIFKQSDRMELSFAVTYTQDSFAGLKSVWAILTCPIVLGEPVIPNLARLHIE